MKAKQNRFFMYTIAFLHGMVFYSSIATLYRQAQGISLLQMGIIESLFSISIFLFEIPWGFICDRIGYKKTILICNGLYLISKIIFFLANNFSLFFIERLFLSLVVSGLSGCDTSYLYLSSDPDKSTKVFGIYHASGTCGLLLSSLLFSLFIQSNYRMAALWTIFPYLIAFVLTFFLSDIAISKKNTVVLKKDIFKKAFSKKQILFFLIAAALLTETTHSIATFYNQLQYQRVGIPVSIFGILYIMATFFSLFSVYTDRIKRYTSENFLITTICITSTLSCLTIAFTQSIILSILAILLITLCETLFYPLMDTILQQSIKTKARATTLSIYSMLMNTIAIITNLSFGKCADISIVYATLLGAGFSLIALVLYKLWRSIEINHPF